MDAGLENPLLPKLEPESDMEEGNPEFPNVGFVGKLEEGYPWLLYDGEYVC